MTFANWVEKTVNMIADLDVEPRDEIALPLLADHPGHWVAAVWTIAAWACGCTIQPGPATTTSRLVVTGPAGATAEVATVACSLHPLGLGFSGHTPADYDYADVLTYPDSAFADGWLDPEQTLATPAWADGDETIGDLLATPGRDDRLLLVPTDPRDAVIEAAFRPLLGVGSTVVVATATPDNLARIAAQERARLP